MSKRSEVVVIGGGISGTAAALDLARSGARVVLIERGPGLAAMASGWTLAGVRQSGRLAPEVPLAQAAVKRWEHLNEELDAETEYRQFGNLRLARTADEVASIADMVDEQRALGLEISFLPDNAAVRSAAPAISETVLAASYCPTDGHANPKMAVNAFGRAAIEEGVTIRTNTEVIEIVAEGGRVQGVRTSDDVIAADAVVVAAGVFSDRLVRPFGIDIPITITQAIIAQTAPAPPLLTQVLGVANGDVAGRQEVSGRLRFTGAALPWPSGEPTYDRIALLPSAGEIAALVQRTTAVLPVFGMLGLEHLWGGLLDMTPDALPVIELAEQVEGLAIAAGFSGHGFCLGPITGRILAELVTTGTSSLPIEAFRSSRFASDRPKTAALLHG
jgi:sarcosine oxidase subunit beta